MRKEFVVFLLLLTGCSAKVSEWEDAYKYQAPAGWSKKKEEEKVLKDIKQEDKQVKQESIYEKDLQKKMLSLLRQEPTPLKVPDKIIRVLVLPYVDDKGNLVSQKYVFFKAEEGKWILGDYLLKKGEPLKELKPLEGKK